MVAGIGLRTIWISLRAMNYTDRAFQQAIKNTQNLKKEERDITNALLLKRREIMANISAGMLYAAMGAMMLSGMMAFLKETQLGSAYMDQFNSRMIEAKKVMADAFFVALKPALDIISVFLSLMQRYPVIAKLVAVLFTMSAVLLLLVGGYKLLKGAIDLANNSALINLMIGKKIFFEYSAGTFVILSHTIAWWQLALAIGAAMGAFAIAYHLFKSINNPIITLIGTIGALAIALWGLFIAQSAVSMGIGLIAGGIAAAGAVALMEQYAGVGAYPMGTRALPRTGMFFGHKGEVVYNPSTRRPTQIANEIERGQPLSTHQEIQVNIESVNTKADVNDLDKEISKSLRQVANRAR